MNLRTVTSVLLGAAILVLAVGLVGQLADAFSEQTVEAVALVGLGLLALGQAIRAYADRRPRTVVILGLILALIAFVLVD